MAQPFFGGAGGSNKSNFFQPAGLQTKLKIGKPGDRYEQEADVVADQVVDNWSQHSQAAPSMVAGNNPVIARKANEVEPEQEGQLLEEGELLQGKMLQRKAIFESNEDGGEGAIQTKLDGQNANTGIATTGEESIEEELPEKETENSLETNLGANSNGVGEEGEAESTETGIESNLSTDTENEVSTSETPESSSPEANKTIELP